MDLGYTVLAVIELYHWEERSSEIFKPYVNSNLKEKQAASGYPPDCITDSEKETYIMGYLRDQGIDLRGELIEKDPLRREIAKLMLNTLYGRFGMRPNFDQTKLICDGEEFRDIIDKHEKGMISIVGNELVSDEKISSYL